MSRAFFSMDGVAKVTAAIVTVALWAGGCSDSQVGGAKLAAGCTINSDCNTPLVCAFQRCHTACETSRDCDPGQRCVASDRPFHVCQLDVETQCKANSYCPQGQVCGVDGQCRDACSTLRDCVQGQVCVSGTCADPSELTPEGALASAGSDAGVPASGLPCSFNSDCPSPLQCRSGVCGAECRTTVDCAPGLACDNSRCVVPLACSLGDAGSDPRAGGPCLYSSQCPAPLACVHGYCSCECLGATDCSPGFACVNNRCQAVAGGANAVEIGPNGGAVTSSDGKLTMNVPAGAIDGSILFSVKAATAWPSGAVGQVYEVEPSGTRFAKPATIALSYAGLGLASSAAANLFVGTAVGSSWQSLGSAVNDSRAQTVASTTTHLSVFGLVLFANVVDGGTGGNLGPGGTGNGGTTGTATAGARTDGGFSSGGSSSTTPLSGGGTTGFPTGSGGFPSGGASSGRAGAFSGGGTFSGGGAIGGGGTFSGGGTSAIAGAVGTATKDAGPPCTNGCSCLHVTDCSVAAQQICCYTPQAQSSTCQSAAECDAIGGIQLQ